MHAASAGHAGILLLRMLHMVNTNMLGLCSELLGQRELRPSAPSPQARKLASHQARKLTSAQANRVQACANH